MGEQRSKVLRGLGLAIPVIMIAFGVMTVTLGGVQAAIALIPILAAHLVVALVAYPLWVRYRRGRKVDGPG